MIGNDIIDRLAIGQGSATRWERFRKKTMCSAEQEILAKFRHNQLDIWLAWAIKESVYKLEYQQHPQRYFAPKAVEVLSLQRAKGKWGFYQVDIEWNTDYIHARAWSPATNAPQSIIFHQSESQADDIIVRHLQSTFPKRAFHIKKDRFPWIEVDQKIIWPLSKSHHGRWVTFAYAPI